MFRLHETTRRRVCRAAFVLSCAVPTVMTLAWIAYWHRPWRVSDAEARLSGVLQTNVRLADWREPRPGAIRTSLLSLIERNSAASCFEAADVAGRRSGDRDSILVGRVTIDALRLESMVDQALGWLASTQQKSLQLTVEKTVFENHELARQMALDDVQLRVDSGGGGAWKLQLMSHPATGADGVRVTIERTILDSQPTVRAMIDASAAALPAWLLAAAAPALGSLGDDAIFQGVVQLEFAGGVLSGAARGELRGVSLAATLPAGSPCRAEGVAAISISDLRWRGPHAERFVGAMRAERMHVNRGLLDAAAKHLFCGLFGMGLAKPAQAADMLAIDALACRFEFDRQGFTLWGDFSADAKLPLGCLAVSGGAPLLMQPAHVQLPAGCWVQFVAGPSANWMPVTQEAVGLAERLPLPSAVIGVK